MEVEVREETVVATSSTTSSKVQQQRSHVNNTPVNQATDGPVVVVRVEEVLLVVLVLVIWVGAIALFFNRWGKIRMLEPYQPKFHQQPHRASCPLAPLSPPGINQQRMSFSKYNVNAFTDPLSALPSPIIRRPRQNSVFVGGSVMTVINPPRRVKSATDIHHLVVTEHSPTASLTGSIIPILNKERRPSLITVERSERPIFISRRRPSNAVDRWYPPQRARRSSCFVERPTSRHRNFISFDHPDRRTPSTLVISEGRSCSYHQPTISFETPIETYETTDCTQFHCQANRNNLKPKISRSFEQPPSLKPKPERMANSLDVSSSFSIDRRLSIPEEDRSFPMDETKITVPLLEGIKSSNV
ncbi:uncharacterized protein LOC132703974 isoform X2 [Cylas formicarius]|uniref:uncharacterized protein LOC132703974 isoform X2 n=1 Tax=Cylas formicarius TaxID=197179 RepID=UPI0029587121|nr:uncharacterized protein LOC132703974 isoform X2 [Cylas formicarius]